MRVYENPLEAVGEIERDLFEMGTHVQSYSSQDVVVKDDKNYKTIELSCYGYKILPDFDEDLFNDVLKYFDIPTSWVSAEFLERVDPEGLNPGYAWEFRKNVWEQFLHDGKFAYTYGERYNADDQLERLIQELKDHPSSRQAVLQMYDYRIDLDRWGGKQRIPCSLTYQFILRGQRLDCLYSMRSCDFLRFFGSDMVLTMRLQNYIAERVGAKPGIFTHIIGSLHAYYYAMKERGIF